MSDPSRADTGNASTPTDTTPEPDAPTAAPPTRDDAHRAAVSADMGDFLRGTVPVGSVWVHTNGNRYVVTGLPDVDIGTNVWVPGVLYHREGDPTRTYVRSLADFRGLNGAGVPRFSRVGEVR
jgi:hypothetical protein